MLEGVAERTRKMNRFTEINLQKNNNLVVLLRVRETNHQRKIICEIDTPRHEVRLKAKQALFGKHRVEF